MSQEHIVDRALRNMPINMNLSLVEHRRLFLLLMFYPVLREKSEYRKQDPRYEMRHNPINQHITLYKNDSEKIYSSYTDEMDAEEFLQFVRDLTDDLEEVPPAMQNEGPLPINHELV